MRVLSFEAENRQLRDRDHDGGRLDDIYAARLRTRFREALERAAGTGHGAGAGPAAAASAGGPDEAGIAAERPVDAEKVYRATVQRWLSEGAPKDVVGDPFRWARDVVKPALLALLGPEGWGWRTETRPHPGRPGASQTWIYLTDTVETVDAAAPSDDEPPF